jgi:hypothetical protein
VLHPGYDDWGRDGTGMVQLARYLPNAHTHICAGFRSVQLRRVLRGGEIVINERHE